MTSLVTILEELEQDYEIHEWSSIITKVMPDVWNISINTEIEAERTVRIIRKAVLDEG